MLAFLNDKGFWFIQEHANIILVEVYFDICFECVMCICE